MTRPLQSPAQSLKSHETFLVVTILPLAGEGRGSRVLSMVYIGEGVEIRYATRSGLAFRFQRENDDTDGKGQTDSRPCRAASAPAQLVEVAAIVVLAKEGRARQQGLLVDEAQAIGKLVGRADLLALPF